MSGTPCYLVHELDAQILETEKMSDQEIYTDFSSHIFKVDLPFARILLRNYINESLDEQLADFKKMIPLAQNYVSKRAAERMIEQVRRQKRILATIEV